MPKFLDGTDTTWSADGSRPLKVRGEFPLPDEKSAREAVREFLARHAAEIAMPFPVEGLKLANEATTPVRTVYRYEHTVEGLPVLNAELLVQVDKRSRIRQIDTFSGPTRIVPAPAGAKAISSDEALAAAGRAVGAYKKRIDMPAPRAVWYPTKQGLVRAYQVLIATKDPHDWHVVVNAYDGSVLEKRDLIKQFPDGTGLVFNPNPVVTANNNTYRDPSATAATCGFTGTPQATIDAQRVSETLKDLTSSGGALTLDGPYCTIKEIASPTTAIPSEASGIFNYGSDDEKFEAVMIYYHIDTYQRYLQSIGITGAHPTAIECDPHDNSIIAAWYSPYDKALHFSDSGNCLPDRAEDADCMIHEYGHAIQDYQVPGWGGTNATTGRDETGAMGEGFGDASACIYFADAGGGFQREVFEDWVFGSGGGLRRVDGTKVYPADWAYEVHSDGEIWSAALWNIYRAIGGDSSSASDRAEARKAILRSVIESHPLLATTATMPEGAEAVMTTNAELDDYRGMHLMAMLDSFNDRGILAVDPAADLYIRDDTADPGTESYHAATFWDSPDVWVRNSDDGGTTHQDPKAGQDNWFYARVRNRGTASARALVVTFNVKLWLGTEFVYPNDFISPLISAAPAFNLGAGGSTIVKAKWPAAYVPASGSHGCLLVSAYTPSDVAATGAHTWEHGNLAQKNLTVLAADAGDILMVPFRIGNKLRTVGEIIRLEIRKSEAEIPIALVINKSVLGSLVHGGVPVGAAKEGAGEGGGKRPYGAGQSIGYEAREIPAVGHGGAALTELAFGASRTVSVPIQLGRRRDIPFHLKVSVPKNARSKSSYVFDVVERDAMDRTLGGVRVRVNVR